MMYGWMAGSDYSYARSEKHRQTSGFTIIEYGHEQ